MNADEIRKYAPQGIDLGGGEKGFSAPALEFMKFLMIREVAAQLADLNRTLRQMRVDNGADVDSEYVQ